MTGKTAPIDIYKLLTTVSDKVIKSSDDRANLQIIMDIHWFFLYSKSLKEDKRYKKHIGKWKYHAVSPSDLFKNISQILPSVASATLPVVKFTNIANVFSGERLIVVYCFPTGPDPTEAKNILTSMGWCDFFWGSHRYQAP